MRLLLCVLTALVIHRTSIASPPDTVKPAPHFVVEDAYGHKLNITQQKNKVIFLNFWALTCAPCKAEMPGIDSLRKQFSNDTNLLVLPIDVDHNFAASTRYMYDKGFALTVYTPSGIVPQVLFQGELPTTVVVDKKGNIVFFQQGEYSYNTQAFFERIEAWLKQ